MIIANVFGQPFVKRFALRYRTVVLSVLSVMLVYCGQKAGWMKTPLGTEVDLGPGHTVLDEDPAPSPRERGPAAPLFIRPMSVMATVAHPSYW